MLGIDTNVLVRFITRDDAIQAEQARGVITAQQNQPIYICLVVLVELVWILTKVKRRQSKDVFDTCRGLLQSPDFVLEDAKTVEQCLADAEHADCDLADALIAAINARAGCRTTVTFDRDAHNLAGMTPVATLL